MVNLDIINGFRISVKLMLSLGVSVLPKSYFGVFILCLPVEPIVIVC